MAIEINDTGIVHQGGTTTFQEIEDTQTLTENIADFKKPNMFKPLFEKSSPHSITIPVGTNVLVGTTYVKKTAITTVDLDTDLDTGSKVAGTDYYVYAKADGSFYISADKTITTDRLIGGFHYGLTGETEAPTGNKTETDMSKIRGINAYSFWDLRWMPNNGMPEAMFYAKGKWFDIYPVDDEYAFRGYGKASTTIAGGATDYGRATPKIPTAYGGDGTLRYGKLTWFVSAELAAAANKQLMSYEDFCGVAYGVVEGTDAATVGETVQGAVEHYPELTSIYGMEQATGVQYVWGSDKGSAATGTWSSITDGRGNVYQDVNAVDLGGSRSSGTVAGSRCSSWSGSVSDSNWSDGARFACDHLILA